MARYVQGYSHSEASRLANQADAFEELIHGGTAFPDGARVLEAGCGVGGQTVVLARRSPGAEFMCFDISESSLSVARARTAELGISNVAFSQADLLHLNLDAASFDHVFTCFTLEYIPDPALVLGSLYRALRPGGTITVVEPDHGTTYFHPETAATLGVWLGRLRAQTALGGNPKIGHKLFPLLQTSGFRVETVTPRVLYVDARFPDQVEAVVAKVVIPAMESTRDSMIQHAGMTATDVDHGLAEWRRLLDDPCFVFSTEIFKAVATRPENHS